MTEAKREAVTVEYEMEPDDAFARRIGAVQIHAFTGMVIPSGRALDNMAAGLGFRRLELRPALETLASYRRRLTRWLLVQEQVRINTLLERSNVELLGESLGFGPRMKGPSNAG